MNRIREFRKRKGLTLKQLGAKVNVAESTLSKYENDVNEPDLKTLLAIADVLGVTVDVLLGRGDENGSEKPAEKAPITMEARIVSGGMDKLPKAQRELILGVVRTMFSNHPELFEKGEADDT